MISTLPTIPSEAIERALDEIDQRRQLPAWLVDELIAANLFRLYTPAEHGGLELDPVAFCEVIEDVSALDASVGWCVWNGNCGFAAPLLNTAAAACAFQDGRPVGNSARVAGAAQIVPGGYRLSGRWDLVSGSDHQPWLILFGIVMDGGVPRMIAADMPDIRAFFVRQEQTQINDKWHVLGLSGTASNEVTVEDAFVAEEFAPQPFAASRLDRTLYRIPVFTTASCGAAAVCLGIARRAIAALSGLAATKTSVRGSDPIATHPAVQAALAQGTVQLRAARAALREALGEVVSTAAADQPVTLAQRGQVRAAMTHAAQTARAVTLIMFELGGTTSIYQGHPLERCVRDVLVASQHLMLQPLWYEEAGRTLVGLEPTLPVL